MIESITCAACGEKFWDDEGSLSHLLEAFTFEAGEGLLLHDKTLQVCSQGSRCRDWAANEINLGGTDSAREAYSSEIKRAQKNERINAGLENHRELSGTRNEQAVDVLYYRGWVCEKGGSIIYELVEEEPPAEPVDMNAGELDTTDSFRCENPICDTDELRRAVDID